MLGLYCPRCRSAKLFPTGSFSFNEPFEMYDSCPHCGQSFEPEPGFYYGSMYISYIFTGFFSLGFIMFFHWVLDWGMAASFGLLIAFFAIVFIYVFRLARSIWIHMNIKFRPEAV